MQSLAIYLSRLVPRLARRSLVLGALCAAFTASSASAAPQKNVKSNRVTPTLISDRLDYEPGSVAVFTGTKFMANEVVSLQVTHADGSFGHEHGTWTVTANETGRFVATWPVCDEDCAGLMLTATASGRSSGGSANATFGSAACNDGVVVSVTPVGGACVAFTPAVGAGPDNYEVQEGGTYTMTIAGVTECSGDTITVFVQNSSTGNFCFNATGGAGTYVGTFTLPSETCHTMPVSYKCGANAPCTNPGSFDAAGPTSCKVHLRTSYFDGSCNKTGDDGDCGAATGACCLPDGTCVESTQSNCDTQGGIYQGDGSECGSVTCPPPPSGACCLADGSCVEVTEDACQAAGGVYQGDNVPCGSVSCPQPPTGACCLADDTCVEVTADDCAALGGTYAGDGTTCVDVDCTSSGACCLSDGTCVESSQADCLAQGGTYQGDDTLCSGVSCPPPPSGACCLADETCVEATADECAALGGTYAGDLTTCAEVDCSDPEGACCLDASTCVQATAAECAAAGGHYHGDLSLCDDFDCIDDFPCAATFVLDFSTDDTGNALVHGQRIDTEFDGGPNYPVTIVGSVNPSAQNTASILNSTTGPAAADPDLLVGKGNILILQTEANLSECPPASGVYCSHNDDEDGGSLSFGFAFGVRPTSIALIDIDSMGSTSLVILTDSNGKTRTFVVPTGWTGDVVSDGPPGFKTLMLDTLANQPGFASTVTASEQAGFDPLDVVQIDVHLGGSGAVDDLEWCQ